VQSAVPAVAPEDEALDAFDDDAFDDDAELDVVVPVEDPQPAIPRVMTLTARMLRVRVITDGWRDLNRCVCKAKSSSDGSGHGLAAECDPQPTEADQQDSIEQPARSTWRRGRAVSVAAGTMTRWQEPVLGMHQQNFRPWC
jgi:hypothetical protein